MSSKAILVLFSIITICQASPFFLQPEKEYVYNYQAIINTGTFKPAIFASQFILSGKLHMQYEENTMVMKFSNLSYKLYNGELNNHDEHESVPLVLPKQAEDLLQPFQIGYNEDGKIKYFAADKNDPKFSCNLKKAVASIMQLNIKEIKLDSKTPYSFTTHEDSIYGNVLARYTVIPKESEMLVQKMLDISTSKNWLAYRAITNDDRDDILNPGDAISVESNREYTLMKEDSGHIIKSIDAQNSIFIHLMKGSSETQFMYVNQTLQLIETVPMKEKISIENSMKDDLSFKIEIDENDETITDLSFGRNELTKEQYEKIVYNILDEVVTHTKLNHLKMESPNLKEGQAINRLMRIMAMLDLSSFEKMFQTMEEKPEQEKFKIFQEMIPLIGTRASIKFVRNLIRKKKVNDEVAISMLREMPFHLHMPSEKLLTEVEDLINMENVSPEVHKTAILSFATLVYKVYSHYLMKDVANKDLLDKYIVKYVDLVKSAQDYSMQYLYMFGLYNFKIGNLVQHLEPFVKGEATTNQHLRYLAMYASYVGATEDPKRVYEVYWPILADRTLNLDIRTGAYFTIMTSNPERATFLDVHELLKNDPCPEVYNNHYSFMKHLVYKQGMYMHKKRNFATELFNFMREPNKQAMSAIHFADYSDPKHAYFTSNYYRWMSTNTSKAINVEFGSNMYNFEILNYALWFKVAGIDLTAAEKEESSSSLNYFLNLMDKYKDQKNLHIEYALLHNDKIIQLDFVNHTTLEQFKQNIINSIHKRQIQISYQLTTQLIMPNDLGLPSKFELAIPSLLNNQLQYVDKEEKPTNTWNQQKHWKFQRSSHAVYGLSFYNPVADIWHGIERIQSNEIITDMNYKFTGIQEGNIKLTFYKQNDESRDKFAMRNYATSLTYVYKDVNNLLQQSNKNSQHFAKITRGDNYRKNKILFEHDCPHTGLHFQIGVFDTKQHISRKTIMDQLDSIFQKYFKNYKTMPFGYMLLVIQNSVQYLLLSPQVGTLGILIRATPSKKYPVEKLELAIHYDQQNMPQEDLSTFHKNILSAALTTHDKDNKVVNRWKSDITLISNIEQIKKYMVHFSKLMPENKLFKICMNGQKNWMDNKIVGNHHISIGYAGISDEYSCPDGKGLIKIDMNAEKSDEQLEMVQNKLTYDECMPVNMHEPALNGLKINYQNDLECTRMKTSIRKYEYDVSATKISKELMKYYYSIQYLIKGMLFPYYSYEKMDNEIDENSMKIKIDYPVIDNEINMEIITKTKNHKITEMPTTLISKLGFFPESYYYSNIFTKLYDLGMVENCLIADRHIFNDNYELIELIDNEWMQVVHNNPYINNTNNMMVFVKQLKDKNLFGLKIKMNAEVLKIIPDNENYNIMLNDKKLSIATDSYQEVGWISIGMINDEQHTIIMHMPKFPLYHIYYDGESLQMQKIRTDLKLSGLCFVQ